MTKDVLLIDRTLYTGVLGLAKDGVKNILYLSGTRKD